ncbi:MAG: carboxypeptidase regulatory-like domain-containing protein [Candidatus Brocadiales bacterium]|nr:carboxypeptidase regulatory-like domain-containing protein [Candidatus Brocadiales bacterium]
MKNICSLILFCFMATLLVSEQESQADSRTMYANEVRIMQEKLEKARQELKREIKIEVKVENGGTITGNVKCKRMKYPENIVVFIEGIGGNDYPAPEEHGTIGQFDRTFVPHVIAVQKGTVIDFPNSDIVKHNVFSPQDGCKQFNLGTYDVGVVKQVIFDKLCVVPIQCNVHAEMSAFVAVFDNPYFAVTLKDGNFNIDNIPPGNYTLKTWHERFESVTQTVRVETGKVTDVNLVLKKKIKK